jgi:glycosyltransferase involved in cell wall biosynthesis
MRYPVRRLAFIASHPIQYVAPLYQRLARRDDLAIKVFFTWHAAEAPVRDRGFATPVAWDVPLTEGYDFERIANVSADPGTHRFLGLRNPGLVERVAAWQPDAVVVNGWAWFSHLQALHALHRRGVRMLFRGDSHLLDEAMAGPRWLLKRTLLRRVFSWPAGFLVVGSANRAYFERFGVEPARLQACPHSIDVSRFAEPADELERQAAQWRTQLGISPGRTVVLFAGKFERKKRPVELMRAVQRLDDPDIVLVLVGGGELQDDIDGIAAAEPARFRVIPFQNQSRMPVVYRLGDLFVLPSAHGETWGLAVNEALACGRPVLVSDRVGCASDVVDAGCGRVFSWSEPDALGRAMRELTKDGDRLRAMRDAATRRARAFDIAVTEASLVAALGNAGQR